MRLRILVTLLLLGACAVIGGRVAHSATLYPCQAAPAEYVAQYDAADGSTDGKVSYPEPRVYLESQGWLKPPGVTEIHHFEHTHIGMCFPYATTWQQANGSQTVDVFYQFHNVSNYTIQKSTSQFVDGQNSGGGYAATAAQIAELQTAMNASAGTTTSVFQSYRMKPIGTNCWLKVFKITLTTVRANADALVDEWFPGAQWSTTLNYPGNSTSCTSTFDNLNVHQTRGRDWIRGGATGDGYIYSTVVDPFPADQAATPVPSEWSLQVAASGGHVTAYVDPHFHQHPDDPGIWHEDYGDRGIGMFTITIPTDTFPGGWHRLVYVVERTDHASVMVVPFWVQQAGDTQAPSIPPNAHLVNKTATQFKLSWSASTDDTGVAGYRVYLDGAQYGPDLSATTLGKVYSGISQTSHLIGVSAFDAAGNESAQSAWTVNWQATSPYWAPGTP